MQCPSGEDRCCGVVLDSGEEIRSTLGVISTLPPQTLLPLMPEAWLSHDRSLKSMEALKPCEYISVYIWFDQKVSEGKQMWARTYNKDDLNCEFYDFSEIYPGSDGSGKPWKQRPSLIGSNIIDSGRLADMTDDEVIERTLREIQESFPLALEAKVLHTVVNRVPMAIHRPVVGTEKLRPEQRSSVRDFYIAGCWTKTDFPCSMESAARSGYLAADKLLQLRGRESRSASSVAHCMLQAVRERPTNILCQHLSFCICFGMIQVAYCSRLMFQVGSKLVGSMQVTQVTNNSEKNLTHLKVEELVN